jgi:hypothetical protein
VRRNKSPYRSVFADPLRAAAGFIGGRRASIMVIPAGSVILARVMTMMTGGSGVERRGGKPRAQAHYGRHRHQQDDEPACGSR